MIVLAGIDEAGLGPTLGPLATGCAAMAVPDCWEPAEPWSAFADACCRSLGRGETRIGVADSKVLYRIGGIAALELAVGVFSTLANNRPVPDLIKDTAGGTETHPCYSHGLEPFPLHIDQDAVGRHAEKMLAVLRRAGAAVVHLAGALAFETELNHRFRAGLNKNEALLMETGRHLRKLAERFQDCPIRVVVDKQGGRNDYLPFLVALFPGQWPREIEAGAERSMYRLSRPGGTMEIVFQAKADRDSFATALASLAAKYLRERAMAEFNKWFCARMPGLQETAGYPTDARRWLAAVRERAAELLVDLVVRTR